ncbi:MAG: DUF3810 family protein [Vulcanimicrobiaceae bacterium]
MPRERRQSTKESPIHGGSFAFWLRVVLVVAGIVAFTFRPSPAWVGGPYVNGIYPIWEHAAAAIASTVPFSLGDSAVLLGVGWLAWRIAVALRRRTWRASGILALDALALAAFYLIWFLVAWGWCYQRAPLQTRLAYHPSAVTTAAAVRLRTLAIAQINALAPLAHAQAKQPLNLVALRKAWLPVVQRFGDDWKPHVGAPKFTLAEPFMVANGTSGFINPLTLEAQLAPDLFWFERPFDLAHEWTHIAGFAREDEANYAAVLTCLRSRDVVDRYSGWLELFMYLPPKKHYAADTFTPLVWSDFAAIRQRNARHINLAFARFSWGAYNTYLKNNHVASGIANYNEVTRLVLGIPLNRAGLPRVRS